MTTVIISQVALLIWFCGCITTYRIGKLTLVEGMGIKSAEFVMLCVFISGCILYHSFHSVGRWVLLAILLLWFIVQFFCHWYFTIFGASKKKLESYNSCFRNTIRLLPKNEKRIVPDFYHIVLHILIVLNIVCCLVYI